MDFDEAIDLWQQSYAGYRADGDGVGAVRVARMLGYMYGIVVGEWAIGSGWIARAQHLLDVAADSSERGWVALNLGMFERDRSVKHRRFEEALEVASATHDNNLAFAALAYLGASLVYADRVEEGMVRLDESLAAVLLALFVIGCTTAVRRGKAQYTKLAETQPPQPDQPSSGQPVAGRQSA